MASSSSSSAAPVQMLDFRQLGPHGYLKGDILVAGEPGLFGFLLGAGMPLEDVKQLKRSLRLSTMGRKPYPFEDRQTPGDDYLNARDIMFLLHTSYHRISMFTMINLDPLRVSNNELSEQEKKSIGIQLSSPPKNLITNQQILELASIEAQRLYPMFNPQTCKYIQVVYERIRDEIIEGDTDFHDMCDDLAREGWVTEGNSMCIHCGSITVSSP